jgi:hypothetical protein
MRGAAQHQPPAEPLPGHVDERRHRVSVLSRNHAITQTR